MQLLSFPEELLERILEEVILYPSPSHSAQSSLEAPSTCLGPSPISTPSTSPKHSPSPPPSRRPQSPPRRQASPPKPAAGMSHDRLMALRFAEEEEKRRQEQEKKDLELALQLDRELNLG
ncbi:hypothetical protein NMY22_g19098 [Coprinellus aureogranulatus]|nr:hypothetical protein NMY22_g19098 [Coprinellus aureogranulatus]